MNLRAVVAGVLLASATLPAYAAVPANISLGTIVQTPSGAINTKYRDGDDGTVAIPLTWGTCPTINLTVGDACTTDLRTACNLIEAGSPEATLSLLSGTLPSGCSIGGDGITGGPVGGTSNASIVVRATRNSDTADTAAFVVNAQSAGTDTAVPTRPLGLTGVDNTDGTGTLSWEASGDPTVSGVSTGVTSYRVRLAGSDLATVAAQSANIQPALTAYEVGTDNGEASSQAGPDWTLTYSGTGLAALTDNIYGRWAQVTGDYVATMGVTSYTPVSGSTGSVGISARSSTAGAAIAAYSRWRDSDDKCNLRYRLTSDGSTNAANGAFSSVAYTPGSLWIKQTRVGDTFSTHCSSDGNTWTLTSSFSVSPGSTVYLGPFITNGATGNTATAVVDDFVITQSGGVSYSYTGAGGSFTVSSYDGTTRSAESAAVTLEPTGSSGGGGGLSIPTVTATVCTSGCTYTPSLLNNSLAITQRVQDDNLELRADTPGGTTEWATRIVCNAVSGTSGHPIWVTVRDGDHIRLDTTVTANGGLIDLTGCNYWNFVGTRDGTNRGESNALEIGDEAQYWSSTTPNGYPNERGIMVKSSSNVAFYGVVTHGGKDGGTACNLFDLNSSYILWKNSHGSYCGMNYDPNIVGGDRDNGDLLDFSSSHNIIENSTIQYGGHTNYILHGSYTILRNGTASGDWSAVNNSVSWTGNHAFTIDGDCIRANCEPQTIGPFLVDGISLGGAGYEPEHKYWNETVAMVGHHVIYRNTVLAQSVNMIAGNACAAGQYFGEHYERDRYRVFYNNTWYGGTAFETQGKFAEPDTDADLCSHERFKNNIFAGLEPNEARNGTALFVHPYPSPITGYANTFKSAEIFGNIFSLHPTNPSTNNTIAISRTSCVAPCSTYTVTNSESFSATAGQFNGVDANGDYDCADAGDSGTYPANLCGNRLYQVTFAGGAAPFDNSALQVLTNLRSLLTLGSNSYGVGDAWPLTTTTDAGSADTTLTLADARYFKDAWGFSDTWGGLHTEYGDCIAVGATSGAVATSAVATRITAIDYSTGAITVTPGVDHAIGSKVWKATDNGDGTCGAVWDNRGAVQ